MLPWLRPLLLFFLYPTLMLATAADRQGGERCPVLCGNMNITFPFGIVTEQATNTNCGAIGFQVRCSDDIPYLGYSRYGHWLRILDIFYDNASLLVVDDHKIHVLNASGNASCRIPENNSSTKIALPFSISALNQELIFYNCTEPPPGKVVNEGLVKMGCHNNTFVRAGGRYDEESGRHGDRYFLEGCNPTVVPVLGRYGKVNASSYLQLLSDGFLLTWQPPSWPSEG